MRRHACLAAALALLAASCREETPRQLEIMLPPWFSPDELHPSIERVFHQYRGTHPEGIALRVGPGKANLLLEKLLLMAKEKHLPDVVMFKTAWTMELAARGILKPLPAGLARRVAQDAAEVLLPVVSTRDSVWAVPYDMDVRLIHYRRDLLGNLPQPGIGWTYEEFVTLAQAVTRDTTGDGTTDVWGFAAPGARSQSSVAQLLPWAWTMGASLGVDSGTWNIAQAGIARAIGMYVTLRDSLRVAPPDLHMLEQADVYQGVVSGRFAMAEGGSWEIRMIQQTSPHAAHIAHAPLPTVDGAVSFTSTDGWAFGLTTRDPARVAAASVLLDSLFGNAHQREKLVDHGWLPTVRNGADWVESELGPSVAWSMRHCRSVPGGKGWTAVSSGLVDALQEALAGRVAPLTALRNAQRRLEMMPS